MKRGAARLAEAPRVPVRTLVLSPPDYDGDARRLAEGLGLDLVAADAALAYSLAKCASHRDEVERVVDAHERATNEV